MIKKAILEFLFKEEMYHSQMQLYRLAVKHEDVHDFFVQFSMYLRSKRKYGEPNENDINEVVEKYYELLNEYDLDPDGIFW